MKPQDIADLKQLVEFLKEHQIAEFDLDRGDLKIRLKFNQPEASSPGLAELARLIGSAPHGVSQAAGAAGHPPESAPEPAGTETGLHLVKSPIVGTFYGSPSPGSAQFVAPGDHVTKGQVIGIVEAMKLMNEIESDAEGEIVKCMVANGQPIEFGQPLFSIRLG
jgi:acetyl-CoA carboxylase biotin carboxyl carrier protein